MNETTKITSFTFNSLSFCLLGKYAGGHLGRDKTYAKCAEYYYWKGMKDEIRDYVRDCDVCSRVTIAPPKTAPPLNSIPVPSQVWSLVGVDIIGPLPMTEQGNKYIVAATDHFSKYCIAKAIPDKSSNEVLKFLLHAICTYGPMDSIITDQGKEFTNKLVDELTTELDIDHRISSAYHPQTNGQRERDNRTLKELLSKTTNENGDNWDELLDSALFAYRTSVHASTKYTPFEVMYGRKARLCQSKTESVSKSESVSNSLTKDLLDCMDSSRLVLNKDVEENIVKAQKHQKKCYDQRNKSSKTYEVGERVLIKNAARIRRFGCRLGPRFLGPYRVVESLSKGRVKLQNMKSGAILKNVYHSTNLKQYTAKTPTAEKVLSNEKKEKISTSARNSKQQNKRKNQRLRRKSTISSQKLKKESRKSNFQARKSMPVPTEKYKFKPTSEEDNERLSKILRVPFVNQPETTPNEEALPPKDIKIIKGDGNCFFRAVSYAITGSEGTHGTVRQRVVEHMKQPGISKKLEGYTNEKVDNYLRRTKMASNGVWATDVEIMSAASLLKTDIYVYATHGITRSRKMAWLRYPSGFTLKKGTNTAIYLQNLNQDHFDVVLSVSDD